MTYERGCVPFRAPDPGCLPPGQCDDITEAQAEGGIHVGSVHVRRPDITAVEHHHDALATQPQECQVVRAGKRGPKPEHECVVPDQRPCKEREERQSMGSGPGAEPPPSTGPSVLFAM